MRVRPGDVIRYRPGLTLEPQVATVFSLPTPRAVALYCGTWIDRTEVLVVVGRSGSMPHPEELAAEAVHGAPRKSRRAAGVKVLAAAR